MTRPERIAAGPTRVRREAGFTFIEVLVSMLIFVLAAVTAVDLVSGAVKSTARTKDITIATWLLQNIMTELETKLETVGFDDGCEKETQAKFASPYDNYYWKATCEEIEFKFSETAAKAMAAQAAGEEDYDTSEDQTLKLVMNIASQYVTSSLREVHAKVFWNDGRQTRSVSATTHVIRLDQPLPSLGFGGTTTSTPEAGN